MNKKKPVTVEYRYIGDDPIWSQLFSKNWKRWSSHRDEKSAQMAMETRTRKYKYLEFRIKT